MRRSTGNIQNFSRMTRARIQIESCSDRRALRLLVGIALVSFSSSCNSSEPPETITGVVTTIESGQGFGAVRSFVVKDGEETSRIYVDPDVSYDFPLAHLSSHKAGAEPVRVEVERRGDRLYATSISDA